MTKRPTPTGDSKSASWEARTTGRAKIVEPPPPPTEWHMPGWVKQGGRHFITTKRKTDRRHGVEE
jgi:hypothetical protein